MENADLALLVSGISALIALGSGIVAIVALVKHSAFKRRQLKLQEEQTELQSKIVDVEEDRHLQEKRAVLSARVDERTCPGGNVHYLVVRNDGMSKATEVKTLLNREDLGTHKVPAKPVTEAQIIGPKSEVSYRLDRSLWPAQGPLAVNITWKDESGIPGEYEHTLV